MRGRKKRAQVERKRQSLFVEFSLLGKLEATHQTALVAVEGNASKMIVQSYVSNPTTGTETKNSLCFELLRENVLSLYMNRKCVHFSIVESFPIQLLFIHETCTFSLSLSFPLTLCLYSVHSNLFHSFFPLLDDSADAFQFYIIAYKMKRRSTSANGIKTHVALFTKITEPTVAVSPQ